jgi:hypothetical protein
VFLDLFLIPLAYCKIVLTWQQVIKPNIKWKSLLDNHWRYHATNMPALFAFAILGDAIEHRDNFIYHLSGVVNGNE